MKTANKEKWTWFNVRHEIFFIIKWYLAHSTSILSCFPSVCFRRGWRWPGWLKRLPGRQLRWPLDRWPVRDSPSSSRWGVKSSWRSLKPSKTVYPEQKFVHMLRLALAARACLRFDVRLHVHSDQAAGAARRGERGGDQQSPRVRIQIRASWLLTSL